MKDLTFDHLLPKSKGGVTGEKSVTAAQRVVKKGGKLYTECDIKLKENLFLLMIYIKWKKLSS